MLLAWPFKRHESCEAARDALRWSDKQLDQPRLSVGISVTTFSQPRGRCFLSFPSAVWVSLITELMFVRDQPQIFFISGWLAKGPKTISTSSFLKLGHEDGKLAKSRRIHANYTSVTFCFVHLQRHWPTGVRFKLTWLCTNAEFPRETRWLVVSPVVRNSLAFSQLDIGDIFKWYVFNDKVADFCFDFYFPNSLIWKANQWFTISIPVGDEPVICAERTSKRRQSAKKKDTWDHSLSSKDAQGFADKRRRHKCLMKNYSFFFFGTLLQQPCELVVSSEKTITRGSVIRFTSLYINLILLLSTIL